MGGNQKKTYRIVFLPIFMHFFFFMVACSQPGSLSDEYSIDILTSFSFFSFVGIGAHGLGKYMKASGFLIGITKEYSLFPFPFLTHPVFI